LEDVLNCKFNGVEVIDAPSFYEELTGKLLLENMNPSSFIFCQGFKLNAPLRVYKRVFDVFFSVITIILVAPLIPLIALMIKLDSRGPVFFRQLRVGAKEKQFVLYKFRTMREDAESTTGAVWSQKNDPRITRLGRLLRKTRLDEIPQLYNVLRGDMSFIGPRPERPEFIEALKELIPYYSERHFVKPGITGWAQVKYSYGSSIEDTIEKLRYDLFYIKHVSLFFDLLIIMETIKVVMFGRGAR
jgi:sugar transferase (PEP-CTERM system associated)